MKFHSTYLPGAICILVASQQAGFPATTTYTNPFTLYVASEGLPGEQVNISFNGYPHYWSLRVGGIVSNITFFGRVLVIQDITEAPFTYLNNYDSGVPLTLRFPTGARAFGAYLSSWLGPSYPKIIPMTATTDQGEVFSFNAFSASYASAMTNQTYFGLISVAPIYQITLSDGGIFDPRYDTHEELIAQIFAVINAPPTLDLASSSTNQLNIGVSGAAGQTIVLLSSTNLASWQPVVTNKLVADRWVYSVNQTNGATQFYRVGAM